jgi:hypothetical protein
MCKENEKVQIYKEVFVNFWAVVPITKDIYIGAPPHCVIPVVYCLSGAAFDAVNAERVYTVLLCSFVALSAAPVIELVLTLISLLDPGSKMLWNLNKAASLAPVRS